MFTSATKTESFINTILNTRIGEMMAFEYGTGYCVITCVPGEELNVRRTLLGEPGIVELKPVTGLRDSGVGLVAEIRVTDRGALGPLITRVRAIPGVSGTRTLTEISLGDSGIRSAPAPAAV